MAQFVIVASGVSNVQFEKAMEIKIKAGNKVNFVPQGAQQGQTLGGGVGSSPMASTKPTQTAQDQLNNVRFEWQESGAEFGAEIVRALAQPDQP